MLDSLALIFAPGGPRMTAIALSMKSSFLAAAISLLIGLASAWFINRSGRRRLSFVDALFTLPLVLPPTVIGYYLILLLGKQGLLGGWLSGMGVSLVFSPAGVIIAATVVVFPLTYTSCKAALAGVDHNLEKAARTLGATEWKVFWRISLPLARRGILAGVLLSFARGMGEFGATMMLAGNIPGRTQTLAVAIYADFQGGHDTQATILALTASVICAVILVSANLLFCPKT